MLTALDSVIESAHGRLNPAELKLLGDIRAGIASYKNDHLVEEHYIRIVELFFLIKQFFDNS